MKLPEQLSLKEGKTQSAEPKSAQSTSSSSPGSPADLDSPDGELNSSKQRKQTHLNLLKNKENVDGEAANDNTMPKQQHDVKAPKHMDIGAGISDSKDTKSSSSAPVKG